MKNVKRIERDYSAVLCVWLRHNVRVVAAVLTWKGWGEDRPFKVAPRQAAARYAGVSTLRLYSLFAELFRAIAIILVVDK